MESIHNINNIRSDGQNMSIRSDGRNMTEQDVIVMAEKVLGHVPEWFVKNKETIEHNRAEAEEANSQHAAELKKILQLLGW